MPGIWCHSGCAEVTPASSCCSRGVDGLSVFSASSLPDHCRWLGCLRTSRKHYLSTFRHLKHSLQIQFLRLCLLLARQLFLFPSRKPSMPAKTSSVPKHLSTHALAHFPLRHSVIYLFTCAKQYKNVLFCQCVPLASCRCSACIRGGDDVRSDPRFPPQMKFSRDFPQSQFHSTALSSPLILCLAVRKKWLQSLGEVEVREAGYVRVKCVTIFGEKRYRERALLYICKCVFSSKSEKRNVILSFLLLFSV